MAAERISTAFHETFAINLPSLSGILELSIEKDGNLTDEDLKTHINLGNNYIKVMPRYARAAGLLEISGYKVTTLGEAIFRHDPNLTNTSTQWLMHYHLSAPHGPGPLFWNYVITNLFRISEDISTTLLGKRISDYLEHTVGDRLKERTTKDTASAILRTYSKSDGLGKLRLINEVDDKGGIYAVNEPEPPSSWVIGYALADYWAGILGERKSVNISEVTGSNGFLSLFFMGPGLFSSKLSELQSAGFLQVQRVAPPHQLVRLWANKEVFLDKIYE